MTYDINSLFTVTPDLLLLDTEVFYCDLQYLQTARKKKKKISRKKTRCRKDIMESSNITNEIDDDYEVTELDSYVALTSQAQTNTTKRC